ncbi:hypothetical protein CCB80_03175 [Armatimonadetes bacterium Uphvl-Ar1]|nr:hypothetical protein CCB80_03175 [Armatimonadetes bacterium Uphvl-Ar1]
MTWDEQAPLFNMIGGKTVVRRTRKATAKRKPKARPSRVISNPLKWSPEVEAAARKRGKYYAHKWNLRGDDALDFEQEAVVQVYRKCQAGKLEFIAAVERVVDRLAQDIIGRKSKRIIETFSIEDIAKDVAEITKEDADYAMSELAKNYPLVACMTILKDAGLPTWLIAEAFDIPFDELADRHEEQLVEARNQISV